MSTTFYARDRVISPAQFVLFSDVADFFQRVTHQDDREALSVALAVIHAASLLLARSKFLPGYPTSGILYLSTEQLSIGRFIPCVLVLNMESRPPVQEILEQGGFHRVVVCHSVR